MPWCPVCKNEYKDGYEVCADCGCRLVEEEPKSEKEDTDSFVEEMLMRNQADEIHEDEEEKPLIRPAVVYENNASKAENNKSSAYTLLFVGIAGIAVIILGMTDILPIHLYGTSKYMTYGIMGALFILFLVMGAVSMKSYHMFAEKAESENTLRDTMEKWCLEELKPEEMDAFLEIDTLPLTTEEKYFQRSRYMKEKINRQFMNLDEAFLDNFIDEMYTEIYDKQ